MTPKIDIDGILASLRAEYSVSQELLANYFERSFAPITNAIGLVRHQSVRSMLLDDLRPHPVVPCEIFLLAIDDEPSVETCIGGVPYRPAGIPWPCNLRGDEMQFLAQFRLDSHSGSSSYPGDIILVFVDHVNGIASDKADSFCFEWYQLPYAADSTFNPLMTPWNRRAGVSYRTHDIDPSHMAQTVAQRLSRLFPEWDEFFLEMTTRHVLCYHAIKLGGIPVGTERPIGSRFLLSICSISPRPEVPYPWMNHPSPITNDDITDADIIDDRSGYGVDVFIDDKNTLTWTLRYY